MALVLRFLINTHLGFPLFTQRLLFGRQRIPGSFYTDSAAMDFVLKCLKKGSFAMSHNLLQRHHYLCFAFQPPGSMLSGRSQSGTLIKDFPSILI